MEETGALTERVGVQLIRLILDNDLQPGDRIPTEPELMERLGVGRNTLREAIRQLVSRNVLETRQGSGTYVSEKRGVPQDPLGITFMGKNPFLGLELSDVRLLLEPEAAAIAASSSGPEPRKALRDACEETERRIIRGEEYSGADMRFHIAVAEAAGNGILKNLVEIIISSVPVNIRLTEDRFRAETVREHRAILEAVENRDAAGARYAMIAHLNTSRRGVYELYLRQQGENARS